MFTRSQSDKAPIVESDTNTDPATAADSDKTAPETDDSKEKGNTYFLLVNSLKNIFFFN